MATIVNYTGDGSTNTYAITFDYISRSDVVVKVNEVAAAHTFVNDTTVQITSTPASGAAITIQRATPLAPLVDFTDGSTLFEADLDLSDRQSRFLAEEARDRADSAITTLNSNITNINTVAGIASNVTTVAGISANVTTVANDGADIGTVAGISSDVTTVSGISANVSTVAGVSSNVSTVASNIASVNTVATNIADVITVANDLTEAISEVETVANDLNEAVSEIDTVANNITNINTVAGANSNITTLAGINANITAVANDATDIGTVATNIANVNTVAGVSSNVTTVAGISADVTSVAGLSSNIQTIAANAATQNINTVAADLNGSNTIGTVAGAIANVNTVGGDIANVNTVAGSLTAINAVNSNITAINTVNSNSSNINTVAGSITNVNTVANNVTSVNSFANQYVIGSTTPSNPNAGLLWFDTTTGVDTMKVYNGSSFQNAGSSVNGTSSRGSFTATAGQTTFTTSGYDSGYIDIWANGVKQVVGTDVTATNGTTFTFASGLAVGDVVEYVAYGTFALADHYNKTTSDARYAVLGADVDFGSNKILYSNVYSTPSDFPSASTYHGMVAHSHSNGKLAYAHAGNWLNVVNEDSSGNVTIDGNLTVNGSQTVINSTQLTVDDKVITVASGAADSAAANNAGLEVDGASASILYQSSGDKWAFNKPIALGGWTITESGGSLYFATGGTNKMKLDANGNLDVVGSVNSNATIS